MSQRSDGSSATLADSLGPFQTLLYSFLQTRDSDNQPWSPFAQCSPEPTQERKFNKEIINEQNTYRGLWTFSLLQALI